MVFRKWDITVIIIIFLSACAPKTAGPVVVEKGGALFPSLSFMGTQHTHNSDAEEAPAPGGQENKNN